MHREWNNQIYKLTLYVVEMDSAPAILGAKTCKELKRLKRVNVIAKEDPKIMFMINLKEWKRLM